MENAKSIPINPNAYYLANSVSNVLYNLEKVDQRTLAWPKSPEHSKPGRRVKKKPKSTTSIEVPFTHRPSFLMNRPAGGKSLSDQWAAKKSKFYKIIRDSQMPDSHRNNRKVERDYDEDSLYSDISSILESHLDQQGRFKNKNNYNESNSPPITQRLEREIYKVRMLDPDKSEFDFRKNKKMHGSNTSLTLQMYPLRSTAPENPDMEVKSTKQNLPKTRLPMGDPKKGSAKLHFIDLYKVRQKITEPNKKKATAKGKKQKKYIVRKNGKRGTTCDLAEVFRPTRMSQRGSFKKLSTSGYMSGYVSARRSEANAVDNRPAYMVILDDQNLRNNAPLLRLTAERNRRRLSKLSTASMSPLEDFSERLLKLKRLLSRSSDSTEDWRYESSSLAIDGIADHDLLLFPYPEIFHKEGSSESKRREEASHQHPEIPTPIREMRLEEKPPKPELEPKKKKDCCSMCKLIHPKEPEKEAPFLQEMRKEQARQELLAYAANRSKSLKTPVTEKATVHNLDIHDIQYQSYFKLEDRDIHFERAKPLCKKPFQNNLFKMSRPRICFGEIDLNRASQSRDNNCDQNI